MSVLMFGNSHTWCFKTAAADASRRNPLEVLDASPAQFNGSGRASFSFRLRVVESLSRLSGVEIDPREPLPHQRVEAGVQVVSCMVGNNHLIASRGTEKGLEDLVLPDEEHLEMIPGARVIPYRGVYQTLHRSAQESFESAALVQRWVGAPVFLLETPPPLGDNEELHRQLERATERDAKISLRKSTKLADSLLNSHPLIRYKCWRVWCHVARDFATELGMTYVEVPAHLRTDCGRYLLPGLNLDFSHGNDQYAEAILEHLEESVFPKAGVSK